MTSNKIFYQEISQLRDLFHKYGRFDDSNAKLDEISKYIAIYIYQLQRDSNSESNLKNLITAYEENENLNLVSILKETFIDISKADEFLDTNKVSIFGNNSSLNIADEDNTFAYHLIKLVVRSIESIRNSDGNKIDFDLLNESFGHFVRDNFRNHIEDAQYMTPTEVVEFMCKIVMSDLIESSHIDKDKDFVICDPCCGVGSFLSNFYKQNQETSFIDSSRLKIIGQDKIARMVRLAKINMLLFNNPNHLITNGNSLVGQSSLDNYNGKVDLILTNPPFGAKFSSKELRSTARANYPILNDLILKNGSNFSSEILFVDRCVSLLKPAGKLLAVLPDSVISSGGLNATLRYRLANSPTISIKGIFELPAVTFAQAGTRTKTSILYLEKSTVLTKNTKVFVAQSEHIGFEVSSKKGATIKIEEGVNDLLQIAETYQNMEASTNEQEQTVLNESPSCVLLDSELLKKKPWTVSHYNSKVYQVVSHLKKNGNEIEIVSLNEIVTFQSKGRRKKYTPIDSKCISVLHIFNHDNLNYEEMLNYSPKYPGMSCEVGDLLFSKINPRILRVLVVPDLNLNLTCSSEFEIMNSKIELTNYGIKLLLMLPAVQTQINYLTSGTSSSHNRIKTIDLANIFIPLPKKNTKLYEELFTAANEYEVLNKRTNELNLEMFKLKNEIFNLIS